MYNINYGDGISFARFRRPVANSYQLNQAANANLEYNSGYKERYPISSNRHSSHSLSKPRNQEEQRNGYPQKTNSQGNLISKNLSQSYDQSNHPPSYNEKNYEYMQTGPEEAMPNKIINEINRDPPSRQSHKRNLSYDNHYEIQNDALDRNNRTIDYEDKGIYN